MLVVISPAKKLDYESELPAVTPTQPRFFPQSQALIDQLKTLAPHDVSSLMKISDDLGQLNYDRYHAWQQPFTEQNARIAVRAFMGDVYQGLDAATFTEQDYQFAQRHLRILSGLYGVLRPLDLMQPYRLEMGTKLANAQGKDLYAFWGEDITQSLNEDIAGAAAPVVLNLASNEYFKSVKPKLLDVPVLTLQFKDKKGDQYKIVSFYAKKARGLMAAHVIRHQITDPEQLKTATVGGYEFNEELSSPKEWVFTRDDA